AAADSDCEGPGWRRSETGNEELCRARVTVCPRVPSARRCVQEVLRRWWRMQKLVLRMRLHGTAALARRTYKRGSLCKSSGGASTALVPHVSNHLGGSEYPTYRVSKKRNTREFVTRTRPKIRAGHYADQAAVYDGRQISLREDPLPPRDF